MASRGRGPPAWLFIVLAAAAAGAAWILATSGQRPDRTPKSVEPTDVADAPEPARGWAPRPRPKTTPVPAGCEPHASTVCLRGDAWWLDSCGNPHELAEECGLAPCADGVCEGTDPQCVDGPLFGECDGDIARGCAAGRHYAIDCAAQDRRCVMAEEGPACRELSGPRCTPAGDPPRCDGDVLVACIDGEQRRVDCGLSAATCMPTRGGTTLGCVRWGAAAVGDDCGACGCPPSPEAEEICDGKDNDGDDFIDENVDCGDVMLLPIVIVDGDGNTAYTKEDLDAELARVNAAFAREDDYGLRFALDEPIWLAEEAWLSLEEEETMQLLSGGRLMYDRPHFYIPIVFTNEVIVDGVPRPGLATPPNGTCGGQRRVRSPQPALGGVVIGKRRWPTTVAHEIGHHLGLCHTHMPSVDAVEVRAGSPEVADEATACNEPCALEGDGVCDTPTDPGPDGCQLDGACGPMCSDGSVPDPANIMGYYPDCRSLFSEEQARLMRASLALRRAWNRCIFGDGCTCDPIAADCPEQMTCTPYGAAADPTWKCRLDGAHQPGASCTAAAQCAGGAICVGVPGGAKRCVRACDPATANCTCRSRAGLLTPVCVEDL